MARIADLTIALSAEDRKLRRDLRSARQQWRRYSRAVTRDIRSATSAITRAAAISSAALSGLSAGSLRAADEIAKAARNAGLSGTAYQRLAHSWTLAGASGQALATASQNLSSSITDLGRGTSTQVDAFNQLGLSFSRLVNLSPEEQLNIVIEALRGIANPAQQAALAQDLLGRSGRQLGTILQQSAADMQAQEDRLVSLGGVIGDQALRATEALNDEMTTLATVLRSQFTQGLLEGVSGTQDWSDAMRAAGRAARTLGQLLPRIASILIENMDAILGLATAWVSFKGIALAATVFSSLRTLWLALSALFVVVSGLSLPFLAVAAAVGLTVAAIATLTDITFDDVIDSLGTLLDGFAELPIIGGVLTSLRDGLGSLVDFASDPLDALGNLTKDFLADAFDLGITTGVDRGLEGTRQVIADQYTTVVADAVTRGLNIAAIEAPDILPDGLGPAFAAAASRPTFAGGFSGAPNPPGGLDFGPRGQTQQETAIRSVAEDFSDGLRETLTNGLRTGDWSSAGAAISDGISNRLIDRGVDSIIDAVDQLTDTLITNFFDNTSESAGDFTATLRQTFQQDFDNITERTSGFMDGLGDLFSKGYDDISSTLSNLFSSFSGGGGGGGGFSFDGVGDFFSGLFAFQTGGVVPGLGNEPQLIVAHAGELVLNKQQQQALLSGRTGGVVVNIDSGGNQVNVRETATEEGDQLIDVMVGGALNRMGRSGELDGLFDSYGANNRTLVSR